MGVTGLWKLIEPSGKPVPVETLEGKILAVDISIWLHQVVKGFQDNKGAALNNAHLLGLFHRLCKLMYYRVKPVFVFDGCVPQLKIETISRRQQQRSKLNSEASRIQALLLQSLAKEKVVQQALGPNSEFLLTSPIKKLLANKSSRKEDTVDDMFKLPDLPSGSKSSIKEEIETTDDSLNESSFYTEDYTGTSSSADDSSLDESNLRNVYNKNLQTINVKSKEFLQLPADIRHEILVDIKETRKQSSWGRLHELPSRSDDFSNFQMKRLLKRRDVQVSLEAAEQEMGGRTLTYAELTNIFSEEGILETDIVEKGTKQISSDEHTRFLLVKDLKKKFSQIKEEPIKEEMNDIKQESCALSSINSNSGDIPSSSKIVFKNESNDTDLGNEYDADLELAIALSLEDNKVYDDKDYDYDSGESLKLTKAQRQQLQNAAKGPARSYMIEYGGMNKEEVVGIMEKTQSNEDFDDTDLEIERLINTDTNEKVEAGKLIDDTSKEAIANCESQDIRLYVTDDSDATISDLEEVKDIDETDVKTVIKRAKKSNENVSEFVKVEDKGEIVSALEKIKNFNHYDKNSNTNLEKYNENNDTDSDLEEVKDSDFVELETCRIKNMGVLENKPIEKHNDIDECIIEETPPLLQEKEELKSGTSKTLNIQIDLNEPLKPEDDLFADIFEDIETPGEIIEETPTSVKDTEENEKLEPLMFNEIKTEVQMKTPLLSILNDLKKQTDEIKNIKLENIKLGESVIEISDDESGLKATKTKTEIIEICDRDDNTECLLTPPLQLTGSANHSPKIQSTSPKLKTPSKNHSITEFFDVNYVVKRTPDNSICEEKEVPKIKSPFFIRKSHKSGHKSGSNSPSSNNKLSKANKNLFGQDNGNSSKDGSENNVATLTSPNEEDILNEAANLLKTQKTEEELNAIALNLAKKREELENERNRQDRMGMSITQRMNADCQELLRLFGVPFIVAPMEAEAQCAFLNIAQLTHGTITDDSDIWLFGGRTVYKNFFAQNKHVMEFNSEQIEKDFNCDRKKLIQLACLVGSDYTTGISGIGAVTALEILASFTPKEYNNTDNSTSPMQSILVTLQKFRNWWLSYKSGGAPPGSSARLALQKKLKNIELHEGFPNTAVIEAYLIPKVDESKEAFTWGYPDVESIREFARKTFGWTTSKTDDILKPVLKKIDERRTQKSIRNYFNVKSSLSLRQIKISKRVQNAIEKMTGNIVSDDDTPEKPTKPKRTRKTNTTSTTTTGKKQKETIGKTKTLDKLSSANEFNLNMEACNSDQVARGPLKRAVKRINLTETKQREKDLAQMEANKKLAIEIFKNASKEHKRKRKA